MGRTRKPVATQTGNLTVEFQQQRALEESLSAGKVLAEMRPPKTLVNSEAKKLWKWAVNLLKDMPLVGELDVLNLEGMCNAFAQYRNATEAVKRCISKNDKDSTILDEETITVMNAAMNAQKKCAEEYRAFARLCGFTVDSRLKLAAIRSKEIDDDITEEFGDI